MPQEFHVVRCYACQVFQVQQVKKLPKWQCKMCGEKQSLKKEYGRGTGSDCRRHVQKLNMTAGESSDSHGGTGLYGHCAIPSSYHKDEEPRVMQEGTYFEKPKAEKETSKWKTFINDEEDVDDDDTPGNSFQEAAQHPYLDNAEVTLSRPEKQRRGGRKYDGWDSGRKRKRDFDQDMTEYEKPTVQQNRNSPFRNVKPSYNEEDALPKVPYPHYQVAKASLKTSQIIDGVKFTEESGTSAGEFRMKPTRNPSTTCRETKKVTAKPKPEASSKWGQFLQDDDDDEEEEDEDDDFQNFSTITQTQSRDTPSVNDSLQHPYNDTSCGQVTESQNKPLSFLDGLTKQATSVEFQPQRSYTARDVTEKNENQGAKTAIFSIEDEHLFDFADEW